MGSLQSNKPFLIVVVGLPGAGKSFFGSNFSKIFNAPFLDYQFFRDHAKNETASDTMIDETMSMLLLTKQTFIVEGPGYTLRGRGELKRLARRKGYELLFVWVQSEPSIALKRSIAKGTKKHFDEYHKKFQPLTGLEPYVVISGKHTHQTQAKAVLKKIAASRNRNPVTPPSRDIRQKAIFSSRRVG